MAYFTTRKLFLVPSFNLEEKEEAIFDKFFIFLEESGVGSVIEKSIKNETSKGGRPNVNYYNLFAAIIYGFAFGCDSLRGLEDACGHDIRYIAIMEQVRPGYTTIANFINKVIVPNEQEIFKKINAQLIKEMKIDLEDAFLDGSKFEANCNKYKFVWKPTTFHERISTTFFNLIREKKLCEDFRQEQLVKSKTITLAINELEWKKDFFEPKKYLNLLKALKALLCKVLEYEEKEKICGDSRNSYYKTDHDATAMCLKADYYSGKGSNLHAGYSNQIIVAKGIVVAYYVSQSRVDINDFIPILTSFYDNYGVFPVNLCADAGYGSLNNYLFLEEHGIGNYVKHQSWEGNASGRYPDCFKLNDDGNTITCLNGNIGNEVALENRHPKKIGNKFYLVEGCDLCNFREYCMRFLKRHEENTTKIFEANPDFLKLKQKAERNLLSPKGIEMRVNRSIQVEGVFGNEKQNRSYTRTKRRGIAKVSTEMMLILLGLNIKKMFKYFETEKQPNYWNVPEDLQAQEFKKPSAKRLSKKGKRYNEKTYNINNIKQA